MTQTLQAPEGFKIIDYARFEEWARMTKVPTERWSQSMKRRKRLEVWARGLERLDPPSNWCDETVQQMTEACWTNGTITVRRKVIGDNQKPFYRWLVSGPFPIQIRNSPEEVRKEFGMVVS